MDGRPLAVPWLADNVPAILEAWHLGVQTGPALADVLFGDFNPGGKLPVSFPRDVGQVPVYYNHKNTGRPPVEDVRWTSKYIDLPWTPQWPFGHGLSYTTFSYEPPRVSKAEIQPTDSLTVSVDVTNSGIRAGDEVAQLYVRDDAASVTRPVKMLRGFRRVTLRPGERPHRSVHAAAAGSGALRHRHALRGGAWDVHGVGGGVVGWRSARAIPRRGFDDALPG